jgi:ATP-dependent protease HslVU (ClpYQ) peptidase subunit
LESFHALGSGRDFALAAMYLGKNAREAVEIAMEFDLETGKGVDCLEVEVEQDG